MVVAKILIVEDSPITARLETRYLTEAGHQCRVVRCGRDVLDAADEFLPDLYVLDYLLPDINGLEVLRRILDRDPEALVIMVTGRGFEKLAAEVIKTGAKDYVIKNEHFFEPLVMAVNQALKDDAVQKELKDQTEKARRLEAQNQIAYWMAHNFKNIISGSLGYLDLAEITKTPDRVVEYSTKAKQNLYRALNLIDRLLRLTHLTPGRPEPCRLNELVDQAAKTVRNETQSSNQPLAFEYDNRTDHLPVLRLSDTDLKMVLEVLLQNAAESSNPGGRVTVDGRLDGDRLVVEVKDRGRGMPADVLDKAFEPLFSTKGSVGVGLGLSLARAAVERNGGQLNLTSRPDQGAVATIILPVEVDERDQP